MDKLALVLVSLAACGSSADVSNFTGAPWSSTETITTTCAGTPATVTGTDTFAFTAQGSGIGYTSKDGCAFSFSVSGDTATLSNGPVTCSNGGDAGPSVVSTFSTYTATTTDGKHLTTKASGTAVSGSSSCSFEVDAVASR